MTRALRITKLAVTYKWLALMVLGVLFLLWLVLFIPKLFVPELADSSLRDVNDPVKRHELKDARLKLQNDVRGTLLQGLGGVALLAGAFFAYRQLRVTRDQLQHNIRATREDQELHRQSQITERFSRAIDHLGTEKLDVQLGGIYALERIAKDSPPDRNTITEVLCAYVRTHSPWPPSQPGQPDAHRSIGDVPSVRTRAPDVQAAITVLSRGSLVPEGSQPLDLRRVDLRRLLFDEIQLGRVDLGNAHLERSSLPNARLEEARFGDAQLQEAKLTNAHLERAHFWRTNLEGTNLQGAHLEEAYFQGADLSGADLIGTSLEHADLREAKLAETALSRARLHGADLTGCDLRSTILDGARYDQQTRWPDGFDPIAAGARLE